MATRSSTDPYARIAPALRAVRRSLARISALLAAARRASPLTPPPGLDRLTRRERHVIRLIADPHEWKYPVIAHMLRIHPRTLEGHRRRVCEKLGVHTRSGLVRMAVLWGLG